MKIHIHGIPSSAGALFEGTEFAPEMVRRYGLERHLTASGHSVIDHGNLDFSASLQRHNVNPVRNWPSPRIVWEATLEKAENLFVPGDFSIIIGGDCSIVVGTFTAFQKVYGKNSYLIVVDGHMDTVAPHGERCVGAAGMGLWFLTQDETMWWSGEKIPAGHVKVLGVHTPGEPFGIETINLEELLLPNGIDSVSRLLSKLPPDAAIFIHFDVDVLHESIMPAAYSPSSTGLDADTAHNLMRAIFSDERVKGVEVSEFAANKPGCEKSAEVITALLSTASNVEIQPILMESGGDI